MTTDFLDEKRAEIEERIGELEPLVAEWRRLEAAADALANVPKGNGTGSAKQAKTRVKADVVAGKAIRGRPKGSGKRGDEAVAIVTAEPGIRIPQIAEKMGIKQNYLYRVLPALEVEGRVARDGKGWKVP